MTWVFLPIAAAFIWATLNIVDKVLIEKHRVSPYLYLLVTGLVGILLVPAIPFIGFGIPDISILLLAFLAGGLFIFAGLPYYIALKFEEASRIVALWQLSPLFVYLISFFTVGENFSLTEALAFALLVSGGISVTIKFTTKKLYFSRAVGLMLLSSLLFSVQYVLCKYIYLQTDFWNSFIWIRFGAAISSLLLLLIPGIRKEVFSVFKKLPKKIKLAFVGSGTVSFGGAILHNLAIYIGSVALAEALLSFQPALVFIFAVIISIKFKHVLEERLDFKNLAVKITGIVLVVSGLLILCL